MRVRPSSPPLLPRPPPLTGPRLSPPATETRRVAVTGSVGLHLRLFAPGTHRQAGPPFLLVHGLASNGRLWDGVAERLAALGHRVAVVDQRGHGLSDKPDDGYDFATVTADLAMVVEALGGEPPVAVGQSWGANVVLDLAARRPSVVAGAACVDGGWIELADRFGSWEACAEALAPPATEGLPVAELEHIIRSRHPDWPEAGVTGALANFEVGADARVAPRLTRERHLRILRALWEHRPSSLYPAVAVPVLLVVADNPGQPDGWRQAAEEAAAALPRARTRVLAGDHDLHAQFPDELGRLLHQWATEELRG